MMKRCILTTWLALAAITSQAGNNLTPDADGNNWQLTVADNHRWLQHTDGRPFFWLGDTGWLLPHKLNRKDICLYLDDCRQNGFNVVQVQVIKGDGVRPNWRKMDFIVSEAEKRGIYIGMVAVWGSVVKSGKMNAEQAAAYGRFLAHRYAKRPNIVWMMGGDIEGNVHPEVWDSLATNIKRIDTHHLMTYHPRGRTFSAKWFNNREWLDFNMFQSGHRRYNQRGNDKHYPIPEGTEEDNFQYVDSCFSYTPMRPVLDGEPSYENIPQGLHNPQEPRWHDGDMRRYAYWSVFAGSCGHTYGNNEIMQFIGENETEGAYGANGSVKSWRQALGDPGRRQMKHLRRLMELFPMKEVRPAQQLIVNNGKQHEHVAACRGKNFALIYNYCNMDYMVDFSQFGCPQLSIYTMNPKTGETKYFGDVSNMPMSMLSEAENGKTDDEVIIVIDASAKEMRERLPIAK